MNAPDSIGLVRRGYSSSGGAEAYLLRLAAGLKARGYRPALYATSDWPEDRWPFGDLCRLDATQPLEFARAFQEARKPGQTVPRAATSFAPETASMRRGCREDLVLSRPGSAGCVS